MPRSVSLFCIASLLTLTSTAQSNRAIDVSSDPPGAQIVVDGILTAVTPATVSVSNGRHGVSLRLPGYHRWITTLIGSETRIHADMKKFVPSTVHGRVLWDELPVSGMEIYADECGGPGRSYGPVRSDEAGNFEIANIPDGLICLTSNPREPEFLPSREVARADVAPGSNTAVDAYLCKKMSANPPLLTTNDRPIWQWQQQPDAITYDFKLFQRTEDGKGYNVVFNRDGWKATSLDVGRDLPQGVYFWSVEAFNSAGHLIGCTGPVRFGIDRNTLPPAESLPPPRGSSPAAPVRISNAVAMRYAVHQVEPRLPDSARGSDVPRTATFDVIVGRDGVPRDVSPANCHPLLCEVGANAAREWRFRPELLNGNEVQTQIIIRFQQ